MLIRLLDIVLSLLGLLFLLPIFVILAVWIKFDSQGSIFFRQIRVGKEGRNFRIYKFRTMIVNAEKMGIITIGERDPRITNSGYFLRKYKLDELPQFINVLKGEMSFVGPRPEVRKYVEMYNQEQLKILTVKPGITDYASIEYINEDEILGKSLDPEKTYIEEIMPQKIKYNMKYINNKTVIIPKDKIKEKKLIDIGYIYDYSIEPLKFDYFSTEGFIIDLGTIEIIEKNGKIIKEKRKIPPIMLKNTIEIYWLENAFHPDIKDIYYHYWLDKYKGEFGDVKKISSNPELVEIPNDIKKIIEEKKKLSDIEMKVGEERQGKVITNDTNLFIKTWEKVNK